MREIDNQCKAIINQIQIQLKETEWLIQLNKDTL